jgi:hypothetical protein
MEEKPFVRDIFGNKIHEGDWVALRFDPQTLTVAKVIQASPKETSRLTGGKNIKPAILRVVIDVTFDVLNPMDAFTMVARTPGPGADEHVEKALQAVENPGGQGPTLIKPS